MIAWRVRGLSSKQKKNDVLEREMHPGKVCFVCSMARRSAMKKKWLLYVVSDGEENGEVYKIAPDFYASRRRWPRKGDVSELL